MSRTIKASLLLIFTGILAVGAGLFFTMTGRQQLARDTQSAKAIVAEYAEGSEFDSVTNTMDTVYYPVVTFEAGGKTVKSQYSQPDYDQEYPIGEEIDIKYDPDDPEEFIIVSDSARLSSGVIWEIPLGIVLIGAGAVKFIAPKFRRAETV